MMRSFLVALLLLGRGRIVAPQISATCGVGTELDTTTTQCVCVQPDEEEEDGDTIYLAGIYDTTSYTWSPDIFEVTALLINNGWWDALPNGKQLRYTLSNANCDETTAVREYWNVRTANNNRPPHGLIGTRCSGACIQLARVSGVEEVPHLSPASNTARLSDDSEFPFFSRLVAPNNEDGEVGAIVSMLRYFGWERVTILSTDTQFAKDFAVEFKKVFQGDHFDSLGDWTGDVKYYDTIRIGVDGSVVDESLDQVLSNVPVDNPDTNSRIIVLVAHSQHAFRILERAAATNFQLDTVWVGPSAWAGRSTQTTDFQWLPDNPGYIGVAPFRNRDEYYSAFMTELQNWQQEQGKQVLHELPAFAAETVDSIVAMTKAISSSPNYRDGAFIVKALRELDFPGVSGRVRFTVNGDRLDPQFSVVNSGQGVVDDDIEWTYVGTTGTSIESLSIADTAVCFAEVGCGADNVPDAIYPSEPTWLPEWAIFVMVGLGLLFLGMAFKYWRSRLSKKKIMGELMVIRNSIVGMRAALCNYVPKSALARESDVEEALPVYTELKGYVKVERPAVAQWCWKETPRYMTLHETSNIQGDPADCWIKYAKDDNEKLEAVFQGGKPQMKVSLMAGAYHINMKDMTQKKVLTGYSRDVLRFAESSDKKPTTKKVDFGKVQVGGCIPRELIGEPQMVLVEGDVIQISSQRSDGWAFGTKLHHADEELARQMLVVSADGMSGVEEEDPSVFTDTGWFMLDSTRIPTTNDLCALQQSVGRVDPGSLDAPLNWDPVVDAAVAQKHNLKAGHPEYDAIVNSFMSSHRKNITVTKVERIQNLSMYQSYVVKRSTICNRETGHDGNNQDQQLKAVARYERSWLWHGSNVEVVGKILNQGFNRSFCGKNATIFGKGVYFARDASYSSSQTYAVPDEKGNQYILACRVCVGECCPGRKDALTPAVRDSANHLLYDSTVDTMSNPSLYVTYHDAQAYPEYLITFRK